MIPFWRRFFRKPNLRLNPSAPKSSRRRWRPWMKWTSIGIGGVLGLFLIIAGYYYPKLKPVYDEAQKAKVTAKLLSSHVSEQNFDAAKADTKSLQNNVAVIGKHLQQAKGLQYWPYIGTQYKAGVALVDVGKESLNAATPLIDFMVHLFAPFAGQGKISLATISTEQKGILLGNMASQEGDLQAARDAMHEAGKKLDNVPSKGLAGPLKKVIVPFKQQFPAILQAFDQAIPATHILPAVLGYPTQKTYLFLLENNTEIRPGGGFIGTYGIMKVASGEIVSMKTDNSYNLDDNAKSLSVIKPPDALQKYLKQNVWYFRDSNWSPDFPTSAAQALFFYQREGGQKNVDGVIAITPTMISALLKLVGPITVSGIQFTADNFTDRLQQYVDKDFKVAGLTDAQRKDIIGNMTKELVDRLMKLPIAQWKDVFLVLSQQLNEKQFLMYMNDTALQGLIVQQNWGGAISQTPAVDSILVADANLASLKTDSVMQRTYDYQVDAKTGTATLTIHYHNTGKFDWRTSYLITRYNTFVRVYVPSGSTLVSSSGAQIRQQSNAAGQVTTTTELGKTVFSAFKSIEPGTTSDLKLVYKLPDNVTAQFKQSAYKLAWQKEAGMLTPTINLSVTGLSARPKSTDGLDNQSKFSQGALSFTGSLSQDRSISVNF